MSRITTPRRRLLAAATGGLAVLSFQASMTAATAATADDAVTVVAKGLDNPRGLSFGPDGALYVALAGSGGKIKCAAMPAEPGAKPEKMCFGTSGKIIKIKDGATSTVVSKLPSAASGGFGLGPHDVAVADDGRMLVTIGLGGDAKLRAKLGPKARNLGTLLSIDGKGKVVRVADLVAHEVKHNPDGKDKGSSVDAYPFGVVATPDGGALVTDVGGNDVLKVSAKGKISTRAVFHARSADAPPALKMPKGSKLPLQSVPMGITRGPDGAYYVAEHAGFPQPEGVARVFRLSGKGKPTVAAKGFTTVVDIAFDAKDRMVILGSVGKVPASGQPLTTLYRIEADGSRTELLKPGTLKAPIGMALADDGSVYVSQNPYAPGKGEVVRVTVAE
ncbi:ScyD/ScyE family protein [Microtetraspora sp. AC03309]|uniref:ScyD/ScyE family protein n=1 Tax=Microtetraspora sp. AC03309 TaxID=2779376 RepID=UPI001E5F3EDC|nr:ScyD/ScyE family protein [Microtetraspora sp. AC03309]MCC5580022.1 ScyD/ScyE family protein [Microtetraspora sp. AC03309]